MELLDDHLYLANEPQVKKAGFDLEVRRFSRTISKVAQTVTNTRRIRRHLEALVSRPELCSRLFSTIGEAQKSFPKLPSHIMLRLVICSSAIALSVT